MKKTLLASLALLLATANPTHAQDESFHETFADSIFQAHGGEDYYENKALQVDTTVTFGGKVRIDGTMTFDTPVGKSRIENKDGTVMVFDGKDAWIVPKDTEMDPGRGAVCTAHLALLRRRPV